VISHTDHIFFGWFAILGRFPAGYILLARKMGVEKRQVIRYVWLSPGQSMK